MSSKFRLLGALLFVAAVGLAACKPKGDSEARGLRLPQSPLLSALERKSGLIAYVGVDGNIYTVDQAGGNLKQITMDGTLAQNGSFVRYYDFPTWSPDGKSVAFISVSGTSSRDVVSSIFTASSDGSNLVEAYKGEQGLPIYLSWSPDSARVSFISSIAGGNGLVLNLVPKEGGETTVLDVGSPYYWDWLPDGSGVLVHAGGASQQNSAARLAVLNLSDGITEESIALKPAFFQSPALSPDGSQVLLATETDDGKFALVLTNRGGEVQKVLTTVDGSVAFAWSPDGRRLAYISSQRSSAIMRGNLNFVELTDPVKISAAEQDDIIAFFWSPDSKRVVYFVPAQAPVGTPQAGSATTRQDTQLLLKMYSGDPATGKSILLATFIPTQDFLRTIPYFDQYARSTTIWSPDSQNLVVAAYSGDGTPNIFIVPASGITQPRPLKPGTMAFWSWK